MVLSLVWICRRAPKQAEVSFTTAQRRSKTAVQLMTVAEQAP